MITAGKRPTAMAAINQGRDSDDFCAPLVTAAFAVAELMRATLSASSASAVRNGMEPHACMSV